MEIKIRKTTPSDFNAVERIIVDAFKCAKHSDGDEHNLVKRLRSSPAYIPELDLVAECDGTIRGHILFTRIIIRSKGGRTHDSLALAPVSVAPDFQRNGVGAALIEEGHKIAREMGFTSVILLGHPEYYPKFGYKKAADWNIKAPFEVPSEAFMAMELVAGSLEPISGIVEYPPAFAIK